MNNSNESSLRQTRQDVVVLEIRPGFSPDIRGLVQLRALAPGICLPISRRILPLLVFLVFLCPIPPAHPQGCSQCRESIGQTPIRTQTAYRRAITLMVIASGSVFTAGVVLLRRFR